MGADRAHRVVVATRNRGKLTEIRGALAFPGWEFVTVEDLGEKAPDVDEDGETFADNALIKARAYFERFHMATLADDSGLVVDSLGGEPGVRSARYAGDGATDADNNAKLLSALADVPAGGCTARFECAVAYLDERGMPCVARGTCEGSIGVSPRGVHGFGYDPLFLPRETPGRSMAELEASEKNAISHRGHALRLLRERLGAL